MLILICMLAGTIGILLFAFLFLSAKESLLDVLLDSCREMQNEKIKGITAEMNLLVENLKQKQEMPDRTLLKRAKALKQKLSESEKQMELYADRKISLLDMIPIAGYQLFKLLNWDITNPTVKSLYQKCCQFQEKQEAMKRTWYLLAALFGYSILGVGLAFAALGFSLIMEIGARGLVIAAAVFIFFFLLGYIPYDNVNAIVNKRAEEIERTFPQAVSKLTLLTVAGMEVSQAWKLTSRSGKGTLYEEMTRVLIDLEHNVSPTEAYSRFLIRCNNKYTTKLATSIIQNISKGNAEIASLFRSLNDESWMEHKHNARRMGEKIQSKLLVPTILLFVGIMVLVIVPVLGGFGF